MWSLHGFLVSVVTVIFVYYPGLPVYYRCMYVKIKMCFIKDNQRYVCVCVCVREDSHIHQQSVLPSIRCSLHTYITYIHTYIHTYIELAEVCFILLMAPYAYNLWFLWD